VTKLARNTNRRHVGLVAGLLVGLVSGAATLAVAQEQAGLSPEAALAIKEAQLTAREAELDERERKLAEAQETMAPCESTLDPLAAVQYGPAIPADIPEAAIAGTPEPVQTATASTDPTGKATEASDAAPATPDDALDTAPVVSGNADEVARTLKAMKPKKAALVVVELDPRLAASAMTQLSARNRAKILDHVPPPIAASIAASLGDKQ
jgi:hypothetical protein